MHMELLSPAGDFDALIAAVQNGANAVYLGGQALNARRGAGNFDADGLCAAVDYCHERGVWVYVTVNTILKQSELSTLEALVRDIARAGADAAIVGELGVARAISEMLPSLALHASTQIGVHNRQGVSMLGKLGFSRVVLAREMRFEEISECAGQGVELEAFAHGALCTACSGQCLFSSLVGGRSGNRGLCAQPCRLPFALEGTRRAKGYLLSASDLCQLSNLTALRDAGVTSLKIEGRLKRPEYVAIATRIYRSAIDRLEKGKTEVLPEELDELRQIFNRGGFTRGYGPGLVDSELIEPERPNHAGLCVGAYQKRGIRLDRAVRPDDVLALRSADGEDQPITLSGSAGEWVMQNEELEPGTRLIRLQSEEQLRDARESARGEHRIVKISGEAQIITGQPATLRVTDHASVIEVQGALVECARTRGADENRIRDMLSKLGGTPYAFEELAIHASPDAFIAVSALNELRRRAIEQLSAARVERTRGCGKTIRPINTPPSNPIPKKAPATLCVQASSLETLRLAVEAGADEAIFAPTDVTRAALDSLVITSPIALALPMVLSARDLDGLNAWAKEHSDKINGVIASNLSHFALDWPGELRADFSMNAANAFTVQALEHMGANGYAPSVELTASEIGALGGDKELIVYGRLQLMQLRHCPLAAQDEGKTHAQCARCDAARPEARLDAHTLVDRMGVAFPLERLKTGSGCIVRVLNSVPMMLLKHFRRLPTANRMRMIFTNEPAERVAPLVRLHKLALCGGDPRASEDWTWVESNPSTTGHYFRGVE